MYKLYSYIKNKINLSYLLKSLTLESVFALSLKSSRWIG